MIILDRALKINDVFFLLASLHKRKKAFSIRLAPRERAGNQSAFDKRFIGTSLSFSTGRRINHCY